MATNLLLVGRTGNGKSSTGNSILGEKKFQPRSFSQSEIEDVEMGSVTIGNDTFIVVDGSGIGDAALDDYGGVLKTIGNVETAMGLCDDGFDAILLVLKIGSRFTQQDKDSVFLMKSVLGENVIRTHGVIIMTYGDNFMSSAEEEEGSVDFQDWCARQVGDVREIFKECQNRCVLFDNRNKDVKTQRAQREVLMDMVKEIRLREGRYTMDVYKKAKCKLGPIVASSKLPILEKENRSFVDNIEAKIGKLDISSNPELAIQTLSKLQDELHCHKNYIQKEIGNSDFARSINLPVQIMEDTLTSKMKLATIQQQIRDTTSVKKSSKNNVISKRGENIEIRNTNEHDTNQTNVRADPRQNNHGHRHGHQSVYPQNETEGNRTQINPREVQKSSSKKKKNPGVFCCFKSQKQRKCPN